MSEIEHEFELIELTLGLKLKALRALGYFFDKNELKKRTDCFELGHVYEDKYYYILRTMAIEKDASSNVVTTYFATVPLWYCRPEKFPNDYNEDKIIINITVVIEAQVEHNRYSQRLRKSFAICVSADTNTVDIDGTDEGITREIMKTCDTNH